MATVPEGDSLAHGLGKDMAVRGAEGSKQT